MLSRLAQGVNSVLQELSGEENPDGDTQDDVALQAPAADGGALGGSREEDDSAERLAQMEQLVVQLKEMIREKDNQLTVTERQLKEEREASEVRFTKLKLQAKAKVTALNKQISELQGHDGSASIQSPDSSFTVPPGMEEELQRLKLRLQEEESTSRVLREQLEITEQQLHEKEEKYTEQLRVLQAVVCEKDMRFQEQVQKHEEELLKATAQMQGSAEMQQALRVAQRRSEELEEALRSRSEVLEMLQQELNSADEQKQILTVQFRQMEQELAEARRLRDEDTQQWKEEAIRAQAELTVLMQKLESEHRAREEVTGKETEVVVKMEAELSAMKERLEAAVREKEEVEMRMQTEKEERRAEISELGAKLEAAERDKVERTEAEAEQREVELKQFGERLEAVQREKEVMEKSVEAEAQQRDAEMVVLRERLEAAQQEKEEVEKRITAEAEQRGTEILELKERLKTAESEREQATLRDREAIARLQGELAVLKDGMPIGQEVEGVQQQETDVLAELWKGLCILARQEEDRDKDGPPLPADLTQCETILRTLEARLLKLGTEKQESEERCAHITLAMETLKGELAERMADREESQSRIQQLEQEMIKLQAVEHSLQILVSSPEPEDNITEQKEELEGPSVESFGMPEKDSGDHKSESLQLRTLEQLLSEKEEELAGLRARLALAEEKNTILGSGDVHTQYQICGTPQTTQDKTEELVDFSEDTPDEWRTLIAERPALSPSAFTESIPELISLHPESLEEREVKGTSSDEMVTSTDSEVAHSSWTLLEAGNQDGNQEWPSFVQDFGQLPHQSSEQLITVHNMSTTSLVQVESSSVICESVQVQVTQQEQSTNEQEFAQAVAEELQGRYTDLLAELQRLKEELSDSQLRTQSLEEEQRLLIVAKEEAKERMRELEEALKVAKVELQEVMQQKNSEVESQKVECRVLQEQLFSLQTEARSKDQKIHALQTDMDEARLCLAEKDDQARMLSAQLEEKELAASELEKRLMDTQSKLQDVEELQLCLTQKEQEMMALSDAMSTKLLQAGEEKFFINSEVTKLKGQVLELEKSLEQEQIRRGNPPDETEELKNLRKDKEDLNIQVGKMKKDGEQLKRKLQAALVQRKELIKKVGEFETEIERLKEQGRTGVEEMCSDTSGKEEEEAEGREGKQHVTGLETALEEATQLLTEKEAFETLEQKMVQKDQFCSLALEVNQIKDSENAKPQDEELKPRGKFEHENILLQSQLASLESELDIAQKKLQEAMESRKETIRKAKEKDRHHREQLKQQKGEYNELLERFEEMGIEKDKLLNRLAELKSLKEEVESEQAARMELEKRFQDSQEFLSLRESEVQQLQEELKLLREKERQIDALSLELEDLREKYQQAEKQAEILKVEVEATAALGPKGVGDSVDSPISQLQAEVEEFKQFLNCKNNEILELSQQLGEQNSLLQVMQETVSEKDQLIASLQDNLKNEKEKNQKLEAGMLLQQEEEKGSESKLQQLQRKLQAALISRKDALKESKMLKETMELLERDKVELCMKLEAGQSELEKLRAEKEKLIVEVDRALLENQSLGASCESLKLAMEGVVKEKELYQQDVAAAKERTEQVNREWEEKVQAMKEEYETLLTSYENVSDEAERVRRVLEAAKQERQELAAKAKIHEAAKQEAERLVEEAQKEVDAVKEKMRKFAKTKQQKIMDLEEENERLREMEEKKGEGARGDKHKEDLRRAEEELARTKEELAGTKEELATLRANLNATRTQMDVLEQEAVNLRDQMTQEREKSTPTSAHSPGSVSLVEDSLIVQQSSNMMTQSPEKLDSDPQDFDQTDEMVALEVDGHSQDPVKETPKMETVHIQDSAEKIRQLEEALKVEKESWHVHKAQLAAQLISLEQQLQDSRLREANLRDEIVKWEAKYQEVQARLEAERDDLEECLMNQLAQVNGSIAGYQQEAADGRERLMELQRIMENLERERAEFEAQANSEKDRALRLEEDKRQAQRERAEAEAEVRRQRELEQKLKSAQRGKEGSQNRARQLEELLREKQLEVKQMQKDCIQYQEKISEQEKEAKALQLGREEAQRELAAAHLETTKIMGKMTKVEAELSACKVSLDDASSEVAKLQAEKRASEEHFLQREAEIKAEGERTLDSVRLRLGAELKQAEIRLEDLLKEKEWGDKATQEARKLAEAREQLAQEMQARLDASLARLAAFSRSMSSLQDDRDRVLDEARQWESRFHGALQGKEAELREAETRARDLEEQLQKETAQREELHLVVERLQEALENWKLKYQEQEKMYGESRATLEKEQEKLKEALARAENSLAQKSTLLTSLEAEAEGLRHRAQALEEAVGELQREVEEARITLREREAEERRLVLSLEQLETDLRSSKTLTERLQTQLGEKERREIELLGEKEQAVAQAADEARREAEGRALEAEKEVERRREQVQALEEKAQKAVEESSQSRARLDAFTKAMASLQDDRDRVLSQYKQLEERHLQVMIEKDALIQEAAQENNSLKEELRSLLVQRDDLNAEKAKLSAQLYGYRDDLTQVLNMKDSQHKQLLAAQLERIRALEKEKSQALARVQELESEQEHRLAQLEALKRQKEEATEVQSRVERETLSQASSRERRGVGESPEKEEEEEMVQQLREQLAASQRQVTALQEEMSAEQDGDKARKKELRELRWECGVLRTQAETAEERVAELSRDLLSLEQKLLQEREETAQLRAQNQSFGQAMASLQDSRDQAMNEAQELRLRVEEMRRTGPQPQVSSSPPAGSSNEVWALKNALSALQNDRERLLEQLQQQKSELSQLVSLAEELQEEKRKAEEGHQREEVMQQERRQEQERLMKELQDKDEQLERERQELEVLRQEREDWQAQADSFKQQTLTTLSEQDEQIRHLNCMLEEARALRPKIVEEQYQRELKASFGTVLSSQGQVLQADSGELSSQLNDTLRELHLKELKITELGSKLSQVFEEKRLLSTQLRGSSHRLGDAQSRCSALERQLQELQEDKRKGITEVDSAPGGPQERSDPGGSDGYKAEIKELQRRLDDEQEQKQVLEEQLLAAHDRLKRYTMGDWQSGAEGNFSETAVLIEPPEGAVTRARSGGMGLSRMLRIAFCSRQRTPLLVFLYLLTVHVLLVLCMGGYL